MRNIYQSSSLCASLLLLCFTTGCSAQIDTEQHNKAVAAASNSPQSLQSYQVHAIADFNEPWAFVELPNGQLLITEKAGKLKLFNPKTRQILDVQAVPRVAYGGQGGLGGCRIRPRFSAESVYLFKLC